MGLLSGTQLIDELVRRLTNEQRSDALAALNRAQKWVLRQGSFQFMMSAPVTLNPVQGSNPNLAAVATYAGSIEASKGKMMFNTDGTPIKHIPLSDFWNSLNYNLPATTSYDCYTIQTVNSAAVDPQHTFYFLPNQSGTAFFYFHRVATPLQDSSGIFSELPADFDDLLVDLAEAEERRIYDIGDSWQLLLGRAQDQIKVLLDGYRSETQQETGLNDAQLKAQEQTQVGRN